MAGEGSIQGMINSLKNNRKLLRPKRSFLNRRKEFLIAAKGELNLKTASKEDLKRIREKVNKERKKQLRIDIAIWSGILISITVLLFMFVSNFLEHKNQSEEENSTIKKTEYLNLIADGDQWLAQQKWHNAIFQYQKAMELFPAEYDINYRLTYAYCLRCQADYDTCKEAKTYFDKLLAEYPNKRELLELRKMLEYEYE